MTTKTRKTNRNQKKGQKLFHNLHVLEDGKRRALTDSEQDQIIAMLALRECPDALSVDSLIPNLHRIAIGSELSRHAEGWSLHIVTKKGERTYHRPELWPELTPFLDALIMLDMTGSDFWEAYEGKCGMPLFSRDGGESSPATSWPTRCWHRHFGIGAHIIRSLWHSLMFASESDDQWIALALCGQGNGRTAKHYILEGRKKQSARRGRAKLQALRHGIQRM